MACRSGSGSTRTAAGDFAARGGSDWQLASAAATTKPRQQRTNLRTAGSAYHISTAREGFATVASQAVKIF